MSEAQVAAVWSASGYANAPIPDCGGKCEACLHVPAVVVEPSRHSGRAWLLVAQCTTWRALVGFQQFTVFNDRQLTVKLYSLARLFCEIVNNYGLYGHFHDVTRVRPV